MGWRARSSARSSDIVIAAPVTLPEEAEQVVCLTTASSKMVLFDPGLARLETVVCNVKLRTSRPIL